MGIKALSLGALASLANFSFIPFFVAASAFVLHIAIQTKTLFKGENRTYLRSVSGVLLAFIILGGPGLIKLKRHDRLFFGGNTGFVSDTVNTLANCLLYQHESSFFFSNAVFVFFALLTIVVAYCIWRLRWMELLPVSWLLYGCMVVNVLLFWCFGTLYPIERGSLFYFPLIVIPFFLICYLARTFIFSKIVLAAVVFGSAINFFAHGNLHKTLTWDFESISEVGLKRLNAIGVSESRIVRVGYSWPFQNAMHFYEKYDSLRNIELLDADRSYIRDSTEYYFYLNRDLNKVGYDKGREQVLARRKDTVFANEEDHVVLFRLP
ncbi:MAG: hypothetical protein U0T84_14205 [Chitinophagales bacterium]